MSSKIPEYVRQNTDDKPISDNYSNANSDKDLDDSPLAHSDKKNIGMSQFNKYQYMNDDLESNDEYKESGNVIEIKEIQYKSKKGIDESEDDNTNQKEDEELESTSKEISTLKKLNDLQQNEKHHNKNKIARVHRNPKNRTNHNNPPTNPKHI